MKTQLVCCVPVEGAFEETLVRSQLRTMSLLISTNTCCSKLSTAVRQEKIMKKVLQSKFQNSFKKGNNKLTYKINFLRESELAIIILTILDELNSRPYGKTIELEDLLEFLILRKYSESSLYGELLSETISEEDELNLDKDRFNAKSGTDLSVNQFTRHAVKNLMARTFGYTAQH